MNFLKAISSIFSTLIVVIITLSLITPLYIYFYTIYERDNSQISTQYNNYINSINTQINVICLNDSANGIFIYNYGKIPAIVSEVIINNVTYHVNYVIEPNELVPLSNMVNGRLFLSNNSILVLKINNNYYYYQV
ncbi:MAG: hypothetical protein QXF93_01845 [Saccharolobus sp.]